MDEQELRELEDPENWDFENAERRPGVQEGRSAVLVYFGREDFQRVSAAAERAGKTTTDFIREAALQQAARRYHAGVTAPTAADPDASRRSSAEDLPTEASDPVKRLTVNLAAT